MSATWYLFSPLESINGIYGPNHKSIQSCSFEKQFANFLLLTCWNGKGLGELFIKMYYKFKSPFKSWRMLYLDFPFDFEFDIISEIEVQARNKTTMITVTYWAFLRNLFKLLTVYTVTFTRNAAQYSMQKKTYMPTFSYKDKKIVR